ncbi:MAG: glutamate--tRNA ligase family protein [Oscillospiraceae bacterium]
MDYGKNVTGRFAPSPSGILHLGNMTTCLLTWLDSRSVGGSLVFRMEDLDPERSSDVFASQIAEDLRLLGLGWDTGYPEPEYSQGNRTELYEDVFGILMRRDMLYPCYCSRSERLAASAPHPGEEHRDPGCKCRYLSLPERAELEAKGRKPAWKVKVPDKRISFTDGHYGRFEENLADSGDFIIKRSDGVFAYQLAVSFDDMDMGINRVVRGRDLLGSTARQIWLISELGGKPPEYCHAPLLISGSKKMSKRSGELNMEHLRSRFSPEELIGYMARLLGFSSGEPTSAKALLNDFSWDRIGKNDIII